ncbi:hypothetical protein BDR26DRAFT_120500 [Obelidium mucronatum]|nr:hypothetical protein BDR26DRAFT_120500 [Obelidium mucronatum]
MFDTLCRFKNDKTPGQLADAILELRSSKFEVGTRMWNLYKRGVVPHSSLTSREIENLKKAIVLKWNEQEVNVRNAWIRSYNPNAIWREDIRDWHWTDMIDYFIVKLGGIHPATGLKLQPGQFACDRVLDKESRYKEVDTYPLPASLNDMIFAASNYFSDKACARVEMERRGMPQDTDIRWLKIVVIREWITSVVEAKGGFI